MPPQSSVNASTFQPVLGRACQSLTALCPTNTIDTVATKFTVQRGVFVWFMGNRGAVFDSAGGGSRPYQSRPPLWSGEGVWTSGLAGPAT